MTARNPKPLGLYLHIPFCHARCGYCDFVTFTGKEDRIDRYVDDLCREMSLYDGAAVSTIFFGGGTPSLLEPRHVSQILVASRERFSLSSDAEITMEANPESITLEKAEGWKAAGVNRLSVGLQAFDDVLLRALDRLHTVNEFLSAYRAVRAAGFDNVNIDLIYGLPGQTLTHWQETLRQTVSLNPEHLSLYALQVEEHTPFQQRGVTVEGDMQADMYAWASQVLEAEGYPQYEISNFSRPGYACRHNLIYWRQENYLGLGVGAVGCVDGRRWENHKNLSDYGRELAAGQLPRVSVETLSPEMKKFERLMLGLRLREGLTWGEEPNSQWRKQRMRLESQDLLEKLPSGRWRIPGPAVPLTNQVLLSFL